MWPQCSCLLRLQQTDQPQHPGLRQETPRPQGVDLQGMYVEHMVQGPYGVLKSLEFDLTKFKALKTLNFTK